jgi:kynurenine formamidase
MTNGYINISVNGIAVGLKFGMPANRMFFEYLGEKFSEGDIKLNEIDISYLIYCGYVNNCLIKDEQAVIKKGQFLEWVEEQSLTAEGSKLMAEISQVWESSRFTEKHLEAIKDALNPEEAKKKLNGMTLNPMLSDNSDSGPSNITG